MNNRPETLRNINATNRTATYSFPYKRLPHGIQFIFKDFSYDKFINSFDTEQGDLNSVKKFGLNPLLRQGSTAPVAKEFISIELPFPRTLTDATGISSNSFERSLLFEKLVGGLSTATRGGDTDTFLKDAGNAAATIAGAARTAGKDGFAEAAGVVNNLFGDNSLAASRYFLSKYGLPGDLGGQLNQAAGAVINPQTSLAFNGVDLKSYSFSWDLFPANEDDSKNLKEIIRIIKSKMLPKTASLVKVQGAGRAFLEYPSVVIVNLLGVDETHFVRFKPAMITNLTVDYGAGSEISIIKGGRPSAVTLRMDFTEFNIHTSEDYENVDGTPS